MKRVERKEKPFSSLFLNSLHYKRTLENIVFNFLGNAKHAKDIPGAVRSPENSSQSAAPSSFWRDVRARGVGSMSSLGSEGRALTGAFCFQGPYSAFFEMDTDRDGIISMLNLHQLLQRLLLNLRDEEFERFLGLLGLRLSTTLNFREFQNLCEKRPLRTDDVPQRLIR